MRRKNGRRKIAVTQIFLHEVILIMLSYRTIHCVADQYICTCARTSGGTVTILFYLTKGLLLFLVNVPFYDIVHIHTSEPPSALRKVMFVALSKLLGKKVIVHFHSFSVDTPTLVMNVTEDSSRMAKRVFSLGQIAAELSAIYNELCYKSAHRQKITSSEILIDKYALAA